MSTTRRDLGLSKTTNTDGATVPSTAFAATKKDAHSGTLATPAVVESFQTDEPIKHIYLTPTTRPIWHVCEEFAEGRSVLNPEYQRPSVWTEAQRIRLVRSFASGLPVPALMFNDRMMGPWDSATEHWACIDGKQRLETMMDWLSGELAVPASWFESEDILETVETPDGPYVKHTGFTKGMQRHQQMTWQFSVIEAKVATLEEEADLFLTLNGGGTDQTDADMSNAARVAAGPHS